MGTGIDALSRTDRADRPLSRNDIEHLLLRVGTSEKLILDNANIMCADLSHFDLSGSLLAWSNLREANLNAANLYLTDLYSANLNRSNLRSANLQWADLRRANLSQADLSGANLCWTNLQGANLEEAILYDAKLTDDNLHAAYLGGAYLRGAKATSAEIEWPQIQENLIENKLTPNMGETISIVRIQISEEPLNSLNLTTIISSLTELYTKIWLIQQGRFEDLIEYVQTHDDRFVKEANLVIGSLVKNSPALIDFLIGIVPGSIASAATLALSLKIAIDAVAQAPLRFQSKKLINAEKELANREKELELEKKYIENKLETAKKIVDMVYPELNKTEKAKYMQVLLPQLLQLDKSKDLELVLLASQDKKSKQP